MQPPKSFLITEEQTPTDGEELAEKNPFFFFNPHGTEKMPCVTWAAFILVF